VLFGVRNDEHRNFTVPGAHELVLSGLDLEAATLLLEQDAGHAIEHDVADRLYSLTRGNPLALLSLELEGATALGMAASSEPSPTTARVEDAFARRIGTLDETARNALLLAAVSTTGELHTLGATLATLDTDLHAFDAAEDAGLISMRAGVLAFFHPLVRSAAFRSAAPSERRAAHRALAASAERAGDVRRQAWHLSEATIGADEELATLLEAAAAIAVAQSGFAEAAATYERAARMTPSGDRRAHRLFAAADAAWRAGSASRCEALLTASFELCEDDRLHGEIQHLRAHVWIEKGALEEARALLVGEAATVAQLDRARAAYMLAEAAETCIYRSDFAGAAADSEQGLALGVEGDGIAQMLLLLTEGSSLVGLGHIQRGATRLQAGWDMFERTAHLQNDPRAAAWAINAPAWRDEYPRALTAARRAVELARARGAFGDMPYALQYQADCEYWTGDWASADATIDEAIASARYSNQSNALVFALSTAALLAATRGAEAGCRASAAEASGLSEGLGAFGHWLPSAALGRLELGLGHPDAAIAELRDGTRLDLGQAQNVPVMAPFDLVEALLQSGRGSEALETLDRIERGFSGRPWELAGMARCRGMLEPDSSYSTSLERSIRGFSAMSMPFEQARSELCLGERLRREGARREAREHLHLALATFERLDAHPWSERARREVRATGETLQARDASTRDDLTPQELQIALQVALGKTNKEVGAALFISPKTVELHLSRAFRKLGIRSRSELIRDFAIEHRS
jgi:DNA-binding CsgD family transcriptional regulator